MDAIPIPLCTEWDLSTDIYVIEAKLLKPDANRNARLICNVGVIQSELPKSS